MRGAYNRMQDLHNKRIELAGRIKKFCKKPGSVLPTEKLGLYQIKGKYTVWLACSMILRGTLPEKFSIFNVWCGFAL
jgi:hypothetical protein